MSQETYQCPLCPDDAPPLLLAGSVAHNTTETILNGLLVRVDARLADRDRHIHTLDD